jgi:sugar phosphate isomerase/epimerase
MKISLYTRISDLIPVGESFGDKINDLLFRDPKRKMFKKYPIDHIFSELKKSGVDGLEIIALTNLSKETVQLVKGLIQKNNLKVHSIHQTTDAFLRITLSEIERLCKIANDFSAKTIVLHINAFKENMSSKIFADNLKSLQKKHQVEFAVENVFRTPFTMDPKTYKTNDFSQTVKKMELNMTFDTTHTGQTGENICKFYEINKERIINIHLSDYKKDWQNKIFSLTKGTHLPLGQGELPIIDFLKLLKKENYQGVITMEINGDLETLCQNARLIKSYTS